MINSKSKMLGGFLDSEEKKEELIARLKRACGLGNLPLPPKFVYIGDRKKQSKVSDPNELTKDNILKIQTEKRDEVVTNLDLIFNDFYNYLCFSDLTQCIHHKFDYSGSLKIYDSDGYVIRIPSSDDTTGVFRSFQLDNKGKIYQMDEGDNKIGKNVSETEVDLYHEISRKQNLLSSSKEIEKINTLINLYNNIEVSQYGIYDSLTYFYERPFSMTSKNVKQGPVYWNFYKYLFTKDRAVSGYHVNKNSDNPIYQLVQSGQFGIFLNIFNEQQYEYLTKNRTSVFQSDSYYKIYDKLVEESRSSNTNKLFRYLNIIRKNYKSKTVSVGEETKILEEYPDEYYQDIIIKTFTYLYDKVDKELINDNLVYLHNSAYFINFLDRYFTIPKDVNPGLHKFDYFATNLNRLVENIRRSEATVRDFLKMQYTWLLISMNTYIVSGDVDINIDDKKKLMNVHMLLYLREVLKKQNTFRQIPLLKVYKSLFGNDVEISSTSMISSEKFNITSECNIVFDASNDLQFSSCAESTFLDALRYMFRQIDKPNRIDKDKLGLIPTITPFHKKIVNFFSSYINNDMYDTDACQKFGNLLQNIPIFKDNGFYMNDTVHGSYELKSHFNNAIKLLTYILTGTFYENVGDAQTKLNDWCQKHKIDIEIKRLEGTNDVFYLALDKSALDLYFIRGHAWSVCPFTTTSNENLVLDLLAVHKKYNPII